MPQFGILGRAPIGLLILEGDGQAISSTRQPGSRLKTPAFPIWVACCSGHYGIFFNSNRDLLRNYHAEKNFELHYYTCAGCYLSMNIDNRSQDNGGGSGNLTKREDSISSPLERLIHTKWPEAIINTKGPIPSTLSN